MFFTKRKICYSANTLFILCLLFIDYQRCFGTKSKVPNKKDSKGKSTNPTLTVTTETTNSKDKEGSHQISKTQTKKEKRGGKIEDNNQTNIKKPFLSHGKIKKEAYVPLSSHEPFNNKIQQITRDSNNQKSDKFINNISVEDPKYTPSITSNVENQNSQQNKSKKKLESYKNTKSDLKSKKNTNSDPKRNNLNKRDLKQNNVKKRNSKINNDSNNDLNTHGQRNNKSTNSNVNHDNKAHKTFLYSNDSSLNDRIYSREDKQAESDYNFEMINANSESKHSDSYQIEKNVNQQESDGGSNERQTGIQELRYGDPSVYQSLIDKSTYDSSKNSEILKKIELKDVVEYLTMDTNTLFKLFEQKVKEYNSHCQKNKGM